MRFTPTQLEGAFIVELDRIEDERGFFARSWCAAEFESHGLDARTVQCNISFNRKRGTLRGMHYQNPPHEEAKLVRCTQGAIYDVVVDIRADSPTYRQWVGVELTAESRRMLYVPKGFSHGFQTLADDSEVFYQMSEAYCPEAAAGFRHDDPAVSIAWPVGRKIVSDKDMALPPLGAAPVTWSQMHE